MAQEAERRGYDKDPEVVRVMRQQMISKFMEKEFDAKHTAADVPDGDVEKYYREHSEEFSKKDEVLVGKIVVKNKTKADKVLVDAKALTPSAGVDQKAFRDLVTRIRKTKQRRHKEASYRSSARTRRHIPRPS